MLTIIKLKIFRLPFSYQRKQAIFWQAEWLSAFQRIPWAVG